MKTRTKLIVVAVSLIVICFYVLVSSRVNAFTLEQVRAGIAAHEMQITSLEYREMITFCEFPDSIPGWSRDGTVYWDTDWNMAYSGLQRVTEPETDETGAQIGKRWRQAYPLQWSWNGRRYEEYSVAVKTAHITDDVQYKRRLAEPNLVQWLGCSSIYYDTRLTLSETIDKYGAQIVEAEPTTIDGHEVVCLEILCPLKPTSTNPNPEGADYRMRFWISPEIQFSPLRMEKQRLVRTYGATLFHDIKYEYVEGIAIPVSGLFDTYDPVPADTRVLPSSLEDMKQFMATIKCEFSEIKVNQRPSTDDLLEIPLPEGTKVIDRISYLAYTIGETTVTTLDPARCEIKKVVDPQTGVISFVDVKQNKLYRQNAGGVIVPVASGN